MDRNDLAGHLAARWYLYSFFQRAFGRQPDSLLLNEIDGGRFGSAYAECTGISPLTNSIEETEGARPNASDSPGCAEARLEKMASAYTRFFVGPGKPTMVPWESVQADGEDVLFGSSTLAVRAFYAQEGYKAAAYPRVADDHIAIELDFIADLARRCFEACEKSDLDEARRLAGVQARFLDEHPARWIHSFAAKIESGSDTREDGEKTVGYAQMARDLELFMNCDADFLEGFRA